jgi:V/A-type H+-transporting ATPase subunit E
LSKGIELIKETIRQRVEAEAQKVLSDAEEEARGVVEEAKEEAESRLMGVVKPEAATIRRKIIGSATSDGRRMVMGAREEIIEKVFDAVVTKLKVIVKDGELDYDRILYNLIREAAMKIEEDKMIITGNSDGLIFFNKNLGNIQKELRKDLGHGIELEVAEDPYDCIGGVVAYNVDRTKIFYNTLDGRLFKLREELRWELKKMLFG